MVHVINPKDIVQPASKYAQAVMHAGNARRIVVSGQIGVKPDGTLEVGLEAQLRRAWTNIFGCLTAGGFAKTDLIRTTIYVTQKGQVAVSRRVRDEMLDGHLCASTYLEIAGLAAPEYLAEIEAEAVRE
jgi:2-iminobutanoate/2-iminopropanoate deaminase